eukprot:730317-Heterocapsa_arctica.AAC.1
MTRTPKRLSNSLRKSRQVAVRERAAIFFSASCSRTARGHSQAACRRRSGAAGLAREHPTEDLNDAA